MLFAKKIEDAEFAKNYSDLGPAITLGSTEHQLAQHYVAHYCDQIDELVDNNIITPAYPKLIPNLNQVRNKIFVDSYDGRNPFPRMYQRTDLYPQGKK